MTVTTDPIPALKRQLATELARAIDGLGTPELVYMLHVPPSTVSKLRAERVERFTLESLVRYLARMRMTVAVAVQPAANPGREDRDDCGRSTRVPTATVDAPKRCSWQHWPK